MTSLSHLPSFSPADDAVVVLQRLRPRAVPILLVPEFGELPLFCLRSAEVAGVRRAVCALAARAGIDSDRRADIALAVGEACANAVVHAYVDAQPGVLRVSAHVGPQGLEVTIADDGRGMSPRPDSPGLGLGLPLMASLTSGLEFRTTPAGGTAIWMLFATSGDDTQVAWAETA